MFHLESLSLCRSTALLAVIYSAIFVSPLNCAPLNTTLISAGKENHQNVIHAVKELHNKTVIANIVRPSVRKEEKQLGNVIHAVKELHNKTVIANIVRPSVRKEEKQLGLVREEQLKASEEQRSSLGLQQPRPFTAEHRKDLQFITQIHLKASAPPHIVPLKLEEIQPPEHVDGLRMEQNGKLNADYKKEIFLGNHEEFEHSNNEKKLLSRLKIVFFRADTNHDKFLTHEELKAWIMVKVREHLSEADTENVKIFHHLDTNNDGFIAWKEFHIHFLLAKGHKQNETLQHVEDYETMEIDHEERERLIRYKFRWAEADNEPQDDLLDIEEMKNFRHPEQSSKMLVRMALDIIENLDRNEDKIITEEEFIALPANDLDEMMHERNVDEVWQNERRKEFRNVIDANHDGKVDVSELKLYVDPDNENHAYLEADNLIQLADQNSDGKLSIDEVLENAELFLGSKMVDTGRNFHDEF